MKFSRREFIATTAAGTAGLALDLKAEGTPQKSAGNGKNILICSVNGYNYLDRGHAVLEKNGDTLDAIMEVVRGPEEDPNDDSVGYGGLPNEEGVVELDSCCMHGPTRMAGSVGGVHDIMHVALLAKTVMEHTGHVMLVGEGAKKFGIAHGFPVQNLLTEHSRKVWLLWKETMSNRDWWGPGPGSPNFKFPTEGTTSEDLKQRVIEMEKLARELGIEPEERMAAIRKVLYPPHGTINCSALKSNAEMSSATTTSGLAWKIPGRCGDSPIIGAGCYCDQDVGSAGATGSGEENIKICGAHTIVENMRRGMSPKDAGMEALKRIVRNYNSDMARLKYVSMKFYILRKDGEYAGVSMWSGSKEHPARFALHDGAKRLENCAYLYEGEADEWPPMPNVPTTYSTL
ncbi:MAG TPA: N(4)-(beta-N-acetylglucosaminyl)-L-asparaginase [Candidatus Koribacter sp.]|jgi:N4-(beta-N-acetylglucosaminyl)-L-asparaginase